METQKLERPLADLFPQADEYFKTSDTLRQLGVNALVDALSKQYEVRVAALQEAVKRGSAECEEWRLTCARLGSELEELRNKLSRPKAGRKSTKNKAARRAIPTDADDTTRGLLDEAYNGKKPHSKSEARRLKTMRDAEVEDGD